QSTDVRQITATVAVLYSDQLKAKLHGASESDEAVVLNVNTTRKLPESMTGRLDHGDLIDKDVQNNTIRGKRFAYEDTHEWPKTDSLDYDFDEGGETEELALWEKIGRNWQPVLARGIFLFAGGIMLLMIICCCCNIACRVCCQSLRDNCVPCAGFIAILSAYYEDPMYKKAKNLASLMGLKLDYETYMKIKDRFEMQGSGSYNPLGLPHMA
ncbi:unnamed protein product, partial [Candidula unifasciata]